MKFSELEDLMNARGISSLAEIARKLNATPQSVSNWKARDQVPYHIVATLNSFSSSESDASVKSTIASSTSSQALFEEDAVSLSDILLTMAQQLKVIIIATFISVFLTFTYVQFIKAPKYLSKATLLLPENKATNLGGLAGLASQFGVNIPVTAQADLSSPSLFPELLRSRTFAEKILDKEFYLEKYGKKLTLLAILTHGVSSPEFNRDTLITQAMNPLGEILEFDQDPSSSFSVIKVTVSEPLFAKELAEVVLSQLEALNRFFKSKTVNEKTYFIEQRIATVKDDLEASEQYLKAFNEQNRQISSPALKLEQERLETDVEIQKGIFLTLRQQLELAKIEEVQEASIVQVLDEPQIPLHPNNKNLKLSVIMSVFIGIGFGVILGFIRSYLQSQGDIDERRKLRRVRNFLKKKGKDILFDRRVSGLVSFFLFMGLPFYLGHESKNPVFFGMYSMKFMLLNIAYVLTLISALILYISLSKKNKN